MTGLTEAECMRLLGLARVGRVVFSERALPAIRPVNHLVDDGHIVIRSHPAAAVVNAARESAVVAYEADDIDPGNWLGWSVIVTGVARLIKDPDDIARYDTRLPSWVAGDRTEFIRISSQLVTGFRLE